MIGELYHVACGRCGTVLAPGDLNSITEPWCFILRIVEQPIPLRHLETYEPAALFYSHRTAMTAASEKGWLCTSESVGGDACPDCQVDTSTLNELVAELADATAPWTFTAEQYDTFVEATSDGIAEKRCTYCSRAAFSRLQSGIPVCSAHFDALSRLDE